VSPLETAWWTLAIVAAAGLGLVTWTLGRWCVAALGRVRGVRW
jgi:hypothetical protein